MAAASHPAHLNLLDFTRFQARATESPLLDTQAAVVSRGATDSPATRLAIPNAGTPDEFMASVDDFLFGHGKCACVFGRIGADDAVNELLMTRGFLEYETTPQMVCASALEPRDAPAGITVRLADSPADIAAYARVAAEAFDHLGFPSDATQATLDVPGAMLADDVVIALALFDDRVVAGAMSVLVGDNPDGYVAWVACGDDAHGRGLGDTVTRRVTNEAFARGAGMVSLEASRFGEHTYARMGYEEVDRYRILVKF